MDSGKPVKSCEPPDENRAQCVKQCKMNVMELPEVLMDGIFLFLNIGDYLCGVMLVCKRWNIDSIDDIVDKKSYLIQRLLWHSAILLLPHQSPCHLVTEYDLIHEYELSATFASYASWTAFNAWSPPWPFQKESQSDFMLLHSNVTAKTLPRYPLYFDAHIRMRKIKSYRYFFDFVQLITFGGSNCKRTLDRLCVLLLCLCLNGGPLLVGYMVHIMFVKYTLMFTPNLPPDTFSQCEEIERIFWFKFKLIFEAYFKHFGYFMEHKSRWVILHNFWILLLFSRKYLTQFPLREESGLHPWFKWRDELIAQNNYQQSHDIDLCSAFN
eukprot:111999_1